MGAMIPSFPHTHGSPTSIAGRRLRPNLILTLPFFAGGFLYLGAADLLPEAHEKNHPLVSIGLTILGFLFIFVVTGLLGI